MSTRWPWRIVAVTAAVALGALLTLALVMLLDDGSESGGDPTQGPSGSPSTTLSSTPETSPTAESTLSPSPAPPLSEPILPPGGPRAASDLQAESVCSEVQLRTPLANLVWNPATDAGTEQRVAVSVARDGLERGIYTAGTALSADARSLVWNDIQPGINHFWWILTLHSEGWVPSEVSEFLGATCEADMSQ